MYPSKVVVAVFLGLIFIFEMTCPFSSTLLSNLYRYYKMPGLDELYRATFNEPAPPSAHSSDRDVEVLEKIYWARWGA
jgi:hypothetical protein